VERARLGEGPTLIESVTMRMQGHSASDDASYVPREMLEEWGTRDPIARFESRLLADGVLNDMQKREIEDSVQRGIEEALRAAEASPHPEGSEAGQGVFAD
jgi:TPP-dependent pyruvate/acetoin dehydrogenase alpha subunit